LIAKRANVHRHSIERAVSVLAEVGLISVRDADANADGYGQVFTINSLLLQNPGVDLDALVQKMDQVRKGEGSKKWTVAVQKPAMPGPTMGPTLVEKKDRLYKEEIKGEKEQRKQASFEAQELEDEIRHRIARSRLISLGGNLLDDRTVINIRAQIEKLHEISSAKGVLETMEHKCAEFARQPGTAQSWGLVVTVVRDAVAQILSPTNNCGKLPSDPIQKPWSWMTTDERAAARAAAERIA